MSDKKKLISLVLFVIITFTTVSRDSQTVPLVGDEAQYWDIAFALLVDNEYRGSDLLDIGSSEKIDKGFRRGEPIFPFLISNIMRMSLNSEKVERIMNNCVDLVSCEHIRTTALQVSILFGFIRVYLFYFIYKLVLKNFSHIITFLISLSITFLLPYEHKDLLTILLISLSIKFYNENHYLFALFTGLIPLTNASFLYILFPVLLISIFSWVKKRNKVNLMYILILLLAPSSLWMARNYSTVGMYSISGRGPEVLAIRAEYSTINYDQIASGFIYYLPSEPFFLELIRGKFWTVVSNTGSEQVYDRSNLEGAYKKAKKLNGVVGLKYRNQLNESSTQDYKEKEAVLRSVSIETLKDNPGEHLALSFLFGFRGMFPDIDRVFIDYVEKEFNFASGSYFLSQFISLIRLVLIPAAILRSIYGVRRLRENYSGLLLIFIWLFFSGLTHFIPRYSTYLVIPALSYLLRTDK